MSTVGRGMTPTAHLIAMWKKDISDVYEDDTNYWNINPYIATESKGLPVTGQDEFAAYQMNPAKFEFRQRNPEVDAKLFMLGYVSTLQSAKAHDIAQRYNIMYDLGLKLPGATDNAELNRVTETSDKAMADLRATMEQKSRPEPQTQLYMNEERALYAEITSLSKKLGDENLDIMTMASILSEIDELRDQYRSLTNLAMEYVKGQPANSWAQWLQLKMEKNRYVLQHLFNKYEIWRYK